jgi:hypothetical protein
MPIGSITGTADPITLINAIVNPASVTIVPGSAIFVGNINTLESQSGTFINGGTDIGFDSGIILSSGNALNIPGNILGDQNYDDPSLGIKDPEILGLASPGFDLWNKPWPGGAASGAGDLSQLVGGASIFDPNILEFQFTLGPGAWNLSFDYVFASEEYINYVNSPFNDAFGFFIDGNNIGVLSDGTTIVSVNSINPSVNSGLYRNNVPGYYTSGADYGIFDPANPNFIPSLNLTVEPDGLTTILTAQALNLDGGPQNGPSVVHTARLIIGDVGDNEIDSAVFIRGNSFSATPAVPEPGTLILIGTGLAAIAFMRHRIR